MSQTFYITTAIDYPNSAPHMGHAYEKAVADFYARYYRRAGLDTHFLIGLDEHGQKIQEAAESNGQDPQAFVDEKAKVFHKLYDFLQITHDDFVRTSEPRHHEFAQWLYQTVLDKEDIYKGVYKADYCISCEKALTKSELVDGKCPVHDRPTTEIEEESYFFKLGKYRDALREHIESNPSFVVPTERRNEILARLRDEVHDLSISRSTFSWGVPLTNDPSHVLYVWFDALSNYVSALKKPEDLYDKYWPADCHVIGKDILWFHTVIWPAMLLSAGLPLPKQVYVHGFILDEDGRKMAKTLGNVVDPLEVAEDFGVDVLRYYFLRAFGSGLDGRFSVADVAKRYQSELGNDLGNLIMRTAKLATTRVAEQVSPPDQLRQDLDPAATLEEYRSRVDAREHHRALDALWSYIRQANTFLNDEAPWKNTDADEVHRIIYAVLDALRVALQLIEPVMPSIAARAAASLGFELGAFDQLSSGTQTYRITMDEPLFPRRDEPKDADAPKKDAKPPKEKKKKQPQQDVDPFAKVELRVGRIDEVQVHPDADALWWMTVDLGEEEKRSICAGLREHLTAEELQDRKVLVVANLKPAKLRGIDSRGMILASDRKDGKVVPVEVGDAEPGDQALAEGIDPQPKKKLSKSDFDKAPLVVQGGVVTYGDKKIATSAGEVRCDSDDGAPVR